MARIFTDGAESGDLTRIEIQSVYISASSAQKNTGSYSYALTNNNTIAGKILPSTYTEFYLRAAYRMTSRVYTVRPFIWRNASSTVGGSVYIASGAVLQTIYAYVGTGVVASAVVVGGLSEWHVYEVHVKLDNPAGSIQVKYDGTLVIDYTGDTRSAITEVGQMCFAGHDTCYIDDIAVNDTAGAVDNSWVGDGGVLSALVPTGAGTYGDLTASAGNAYQCVDEIPQNGDTDYIYSSTVGHKSTFAMSDLPALLPGASIARVWTEIVARETAAVGAKIATFIRSGATDVQGSDQALTLAYGRFIEGEHIVDPNTAAPWTEAGVNALEAGLRTR